MIRAVFFDFYGVWTPDKISFYLAMAQQTGPEAYKQLTGVVDEYYQGKIGVEELADNFRIKLGNSDISAAQFALNSSNVSPAIINFLQNLHSHFLKIGILANLGAQEYKILNDYNEHNKLFEVIASPLSFKTTAPLHSRDVFALALQQIGEPPDSVLLVSGNPAFLQFATSLGLKVMQFEGLPSLQKNLELLIASEAPGI